MTRSKKASGIDLGTDKLYFRIGEVAQIVGVPPYVLRYWEGEFPMVQPEKGRNKQRVYRRRDVELLLRIKHLLYERRFTIEGARQQLRSKGAAERCPPAAPSGVYLARRSLSKVEEALAELERVVRTPADPTLADPATVAAAAVAARGGWDPGAPVPSRDGRPDGAVAVPTGPRLRERG